MGSSSAGVESPPPWKRNPKQKTKRGSRNAIQGAISRSIMGRRSSRTCSRSEALNSSRLLLPNPKSKIATPLIIHALYGNEGDFANRGGGGSDGDRQGVAVREALLGEDPVPGGS